MDVSVILINYNTRELTIDCINSITRLSKDFEYEIIVIDNLSKDDSVKEIKALNNPHIRLIENDDNEGTSRAFNKAAKLARGKYVFWLNTDTILINNAIFELYSFMEAHPECALCGGNLYKPDQTPNFSFRKSMFIPKKEIKELGLRYQLKLKDNNYIKDNFFNESNTPIEVARVSGANLMIRSEVFKEVGYFDDNLFMYGEELEFEYRVLTMTQYKSYNVPSSKIIHLEGASFKKESSSFNEFHFFHQILGFTKMFYKHFGKKEAIKYLKKYKSMLSKRTLVCKVLRKKSAAKDNAIRRDLLKSYIAHFDSFITCFKEMDYLK